MHTYIAILRGINVSGHKLIKMTELKAMFEDMGFLQVKTYIQSGNVIFKTDAGREDNKLALSIEAKIQETYQFHVTVLVRTPEEIEAIIHNIPFENHEDMDPKKLAVAFLDSSPDPDALAAFAPNYLPDIFTIQGKEIYIYCPGGFADTKLTNPFFEQKLKCRASTRNWNTTNKLLSIAKEY